MSDNKVIVKKIIRASREELFEAFTNPDIMSKWFYPDEDMSAEVNNTLQIGGGYTLKMHGKNGVLYTHEGEYKEIVPPEKLVFTWNSDFVQNTLVTVKFEEVDAGTEVTILYELLPEDQVENHRGGWTGCLNRLTNTLGN